MQMHPLCFEMKQRENLKYQRLPICLSHIFGKLFSKIENEKCKVLIQEENSKVLRPNSKLEDGSQLIQTAPTGLHRSPFSLNTLASTGALTAPGLVLSGTAPHCGFKHTHEQRCKAEVEDVSHHRPRDPTCIM